MFRFCAIFLLSILFLPLQAQTARKLKVLMVMNEGYRPEEYFEPRKIFDREGFDVKIAGHYRGKILPSRKHISEVSPLIADLTYDTVVVADYAATIFVGGNGAWNEFFPNPSVHKILLDSVNQGKITALICAATGLLATANNLDGEHPQFKGKHVTGFFEVAGLLKSVGLLNYDKGTAGQPHVVRDDNLITARDPLSSQLFGEVIARTLKEQH